jgi:hypothetical protein
MQFACDDGLFMNLVFYQLAVFFKLGSINEKVAKNSQALKYIQ